MKTPVINGIELNKVEDVFEALAIHAGGESESAGAGAFDDLSQAVVGFSNDNRIIYSYDKIVEIYMERDGMSEEDAVEFVECNTMRTLPYMHRQPIILYPLDGYREDEKEKGNEEKRI